MFSQEYGLLTGSLTDRYTGEPLFGVKISTQELGGREAGRRGGMEVWGQGGMEAYGKSPVYVNLSDEDGIFSLHLPAGMYRINFSRYGLEGMEIPDFIVPANDTAVIDTSLFPAVVPVSVVTASSNSNAVEVQWYPSGPCIYEKANDYGPVSDLFVFQEPGSQVAVKYDNNFDHVVGGRIFVGDGSFPGPFMGSDFLVKIYDDEGMQGLPGNTLFEDTLIVDQYGWVGLDSLDATSLTENYYLSMYQLNEAPECAPVGCTQYPNNSSTLMKLGNYNWGPFPPGNAMIRPWLAAPHDSLYVLNYRVLRYSNFDPNLPIDPPVNGTLTELATTNGTYFNDYTWGGMPPTCYAYGIKALYSNGSYSPARISNIVCKTYPCSPSFAIGQTDGSTARNCHITLTALTLPFNNYSSLFQTPGTINFSNVSTRKYHVSISKPGYDRIVLDTVELLSDTLVELTLQETILPIQDLQVNEFTVFLDWGPRFISQFDWQCPPDSICHEVTTHELDLVFSWQWIMTVTYRYPYTYDPAYVEYSADHGRTWAVLHEFSQQENWTTIDIDLSSYAGEFAESGIMFQVHDAFGAPYYLDISRVKIWSPEIRVHPEKYFITLDESPAGQSDSAFFQLDGLVNGQSYRAGVNAEYSTGITDTAFIEFIYHELFPPENFSWIEENDTLKFSWTEPEGSWNVANDPADHPDALTGYILTYIAPNTNLRFEIGDPVKTIYSFEKPSCDSATATLTAVYDLSEYGYPDNLFESNPAGPLEITFGDPLAYEFFEDWSEISFVHNCWKATGDGLAIESGQGHPGPALVFLNKPALYQAFLTGYPLNIPQNEDSQLLLEFDLNLFTSGQSGYEMLEVQVQQAGSIFWETVQGVSNSLGNLDWYHFTIDLSGFISTDLFRIRFMFEGIGAEPVQWKIDNIRVYNLCYGPTSIRAEMTGESEVSLNWDAILNARPFTTFDHYNVFRKFNESDLSLLATTTDTLYLDYLTQGGKYCYQINAVYNNEGIICESMLSDSACLISTLHLSENAYKERIYIYPNPVDNILYVRSEDHIHKVNLYNALGLHVLEIEKTGSYFEIEMNQMAAGIYFIRLETVNVTYSRKIVH